MARVLAPSSPARVGLFAGVDQTRVRSVSRNALASPGGTEVEVDGDVVRIIDRAPDDVAADAGGLPYFGEAVEGSSWTSLDGVAVLSGNRPRQPAVA